VQRSLSMYHAVAWHAATTLIVDLFSFSESKLEARCVFNHGDPVCQLRARASLYDIHPVARAQRHIDTLFCWFCYIFADNCTCVCTVHVLLTGCSVVQEHLIPFLLLYCCPKAHGQGVFFCHLTTGQMGYRLVLGSSSSRSEANTKQLAREISFI
jgi:hypothetical protein